jgi:hypothetical protein
VVIPAKQDAAIEVGLTTIGPMLHVMSIRDAEMAAWESATAVTDLERTAERG